MSQEPEEKTEKTLNSLFDEALDLYNAINENAEPTNSDQVQNDVKKAITMFENCTRMVSIASIFSNNEDLNELPPNDIKFLLLPALLGMLHLKICGNNRKELIDNAEVYFKDFLKRCYDYGLTQVNEGELEKPSPSTSERPVTEHQMIETAVNTRANKIKRFQEMKELDAQIQYLKQNLNEEVKREFFTKLIKSFIFQAVDELKSIEMERPMLEMFQQRKIAGNRVQRSPAPRGQLKPVIITKDEIQKTVFGIGYPSIPTMTVAEFYDKRVADGVFPDPNKVKTKTVEEMTLQERALAGVSLDEDKEEKEEEDKIENDDEETLQRMRAKDEMRDEFRRGWGNRMNRS